MGLDIIIDDETRKRIWSRSYGNFFLMRQWIAGQIGINYEFEGANLTAQTMQHILAAAKQKIVPEGIVTLLTHSDCDGEWTLEECKQVIEVLQELVGTNSLFRTFAEEYELYAKFIRGEASYDKTRLEPWGANMQQLGRLPMIYARILFDGLKMCVARGVGAKFI